MSTSVRFGWYQPTIYRWSRRLQYAKAFVFDIDCCVLIPIHRQTTIALHRPDCQVFHFLMDCLALVADLAGWESFINPDEVFVPVGKHQVIDITTTAEGLRKLQNPADKHFGFFDDKFYSFIEISSFNCSVPGFLRNSE